MIDLDQKIEYWRNQLLDLGKRNRLINFPSSNRSGRISRVAIAINKPDPSELWRLFAVDEKSLQFPQAPRQQKAGQISQQASLSDTELATQQQQQLLNLQPSSSLTDQPPDNSITNQSSVETVKTLRNLLQKARTSIEEKGLNALHLAFAFISWYDPALESDLRAPLLLVPVKLSQADLFSPIVLSRLEDEVSANYALAQKLEIEYHIHLPEYNEGSSLNDYLQQVADVCRGMNCKIELEVELSLFSFNKISMYRDLGDNRELLNEHPVVRAIAGEPDSLNQQLSGLDLSGFDHDTINPSQVFSVLDGDSSQQDAIQLAKLGVSFVLQGPPGTGKSQTITNIIAEFLAQGKRVLFVSEKMAALEVVHRRLAQVGLNDFCLTLHRPDAKRREVLDQLEASLNLAQSQASVKSSAYDQLAQLTDSRERLNSYAHQLHLEIKPLGESVFSVNGRLAALAAVPEIPFSLFGSENYLPPALLTQINLLEDLSRLVAEHGYQLDNPWWGCQLRSINNQQRQQITVQADLIVKLIDNTEYQIGSSGESFSTKLKFADLQKLSELYALQNRLAEERQRLLVEHNENIFTIDGTELSRKCQTTYKGVLRGFNSEYRADRARITAAHRDNLKPSYPQMQALAELVAGYQKLESEVASSSAALAELQAFPLALANQTYQQLSAPLNWFASLFDQSSGWLTKPLAEVRQRAADCASNLPRLEHYIDYLGIIDRASNLGINDYVKLLAASSIPAQSIVACYQKCFYRSWLDAVLPSLPAVWSFRRINHDALVKSFRNLDKTQLDIAKVALYSRLVSQLPSLETLYSEHDEVGRLKRELSKKRKLMPTRKLFSELPNLLPVLKPCLLMSPLAVSTFLSGNDYQFDIVLFDEASQIKSEDAICSILRAKQTIIVGDSKQLPPTDFFQTSLFTADDQEYDESSTLGDTGTFESLLDEAALMPSQNLLWHYRSKHESLIAFSNTKLYSSRLTTFPSSLDSEADLGVEYVHVADGVYEPGQRWNLREAEKVSQMVFEHIRIHPDRSLGIVAFGEGQQRAIEEALEEQRHINPEFEYFFKEDSEEPLFIKNLETVQGDERDSIIFSIGYGYNSEGRFLMNFGPLSQVGGERRLNVAITRGRINVKLVGSIMPYDIDTNRTQNEGPQLLRDYIDYAINGIQTIRTDEPAPSSEHLGLGISFEKSVHDFLLAQGLNVDTNVGCSGYRIDFALRHPDYPGSYAIGIECDGLAYGQARTARDRDRQRQSVLSSMGWQLYRIWSTDWIKDPQAEGARLIEAIEDAFVNYHLQQISGVLTPPIANLTDSGEPATASGSSASDSGELTTASGESANDSREPSAAEPPASQVTAVPPTSPVTAVPPASQVDVKPLLDQPALDYLEITSRTDSSLPQSRFIGQSADRIPIEDFQRIMLSIVAESYGLDQEGLFRMTARCYGWQHRGSLINRRLAQAYKMLIRTGKLREIEGKISLVEDS